MAFTSSSSGAPAGPSFAGFIPVSEKLTRTNFASWKAQVVSALKGAQLFKYVNPAVKPPPEFVVKKEDDKEQSVTNPDHDQWVAKDQMVLNFILSNLSKEILAQVNDEVTAAGARTVIQGLFAA